MLQCRVGLEDHPVLVRLGEDRRDDALPERIIERVVDGGGGDPETRGGRAVDQDIGGKPVFRVIARDPLDLRKLLQSLEQFRDPDHEFARVGVLEHEIVLRAADRCVDRQILDRLHVERDAGNVSRISFQAPNYVAGRGSALIGRFEVDQKPTSVEGRVGAIDADEGRQADDVGVLKDDGRERLLTSCHCFKGN